MATSPHLLESKLAESTPLSEAEAEARVEETGSRTCPRVIFNAKSNASVLPGETAFLKVLEVALNTGLPVNFFPGVFHG